MAYSKVASEVVERSNEFRSRIASEIKPDLHSWIIFEYEKCGLLMGSDVGIQKELQ